MVRDILSIILLSIYSVTCMEMTETVERMVMVRTTGSDLQPAATGFIYKRNSDGPAKVIKMEEDEVIKHLKKLPEAIYEQPKSFAAPIPVVAGPFYAKEEDESKAASHASEAYVIPVVEHVNEHKGDGHIDGIDHEDYGKYLAEYAADFDDYKNDFKNYLHGLGDYGHDHYHEEEGGSDFGSKGHSAHGDKGHEGYEASHRYGKGKAGDHHNENQESFYVSGGGEHKKDFDEATSYGSDYANGHAYKGDNHGHKAAHSKGEETDGYQKLFAKDEFKKDHDFYDGEALKGGFDKFGHGHAYHGSNAGEYKKGDSHDSGHHKSEFGQGGFSKKGTEDEHGVVYSGDQGDESYFHNHGDFGSKGGYRDGKGYGFEVKHR